MRPFKVVLFDEFDAIGKRRDDENEHSELKRVVNQLFCSCLMGFPHLVSLSRRLRQNQLLDPRFGGNLTKLSVFPAHQFQEIARLINMKLKNFPKEDINVDVLAST